MLIKLKLKLKSLMSSYLVIIHNYNQLITNPYKFDLIHYILSITYL
jgi:hypothetical protein